MEGGRGMKKNWRNKERRERISEFWLYIFFLMKYFPIPFNIVEFNKLFL